MLSGPLGDLRGGPNLLPCKDWSLSDDCLAVSDAAAFTIANIDGENTGRIRIGQRVEIDESDPDVAGGDWCRQMTGLVTRLEHSSGMEGSNITVSVMDLGWMLTKCPAQPLFNIEGVKLDTLVKKLIDPSWLFERPVLAGDPKVTIGNVLNRRLKQGRQGVQRTLLNVNLTTLPFIQVEPGQHPWEILSTYVKREGYLLNVGARGDIILFRPDYSQDSPYETVVYHKSGEARRDRNNVVGTPTLSQDIEGYTSTSECWSTVVNPSLNDQASKTQNPNAQFTRYLYTPPENVLPFNRRGIVNDPEAINPTMRKNRAVFAYQMGLFNSWEYNCEVKRHSSGGAFIVSDTMQGVLDTVHQIDSQLFLQRVQRSVTQRGVRSKLTLRLPGLLDPALERSVGGGARKKLPKAVK